MTKHLVAQPDHCLQCLRPFVPEKLNHGRCGTCRARTPAAVWNRYHELMGVRANVFAESRAYRPPLLTTLFPIEEIERVVAEAQEKTLTMMPGGRVMETYRSGTRMICRYTFPVVAENNPYTQTAEDLIRRELEPETACSENQEVEDVQGL